MRRDFRIGRLIKQIHLSLRLKLILSFTCLIMIFMSVGFYNYLQVDQIKTVSDQQTLEAGKELMGYKLKQEVEGLSLFLAGFLLSQDVSMKEEYTSRVTSLKKGIEEISSFASSADERKWKAQLDMTLTEYAGVFDQAEMFINDVSLSPLNVTKQMVRLYESSQLHKEFIFETIDKFINKFTNDSELAKAESESMLDRTATISIIVPLIMLLLALTIAIVLVRSFSRPIKELQKAVDRIAEGDLRYMIGSKRLDELGKLSQSFDRMVGQVRAMLTSTQTIAASLSGHSAQFRRFSQETAQANTSIVQAIEEISKGTDQQTQQSETSSNIIGELEQEIQDIWSYAQDMLQASKAAEQNTIAGTNSVNSLSDASIQTETRVNLAVEAMQAVASRSAQIGKIVDAITEIATQTNILSLNAAIEAARAGAYGKGFSVIAEEVRVLSQQTGESAKNINQIIQRLIQQINDLELQLSEAHRYLLDQNSKVDTTLSAFSSIQESMTNAAERANSVHTKVMIVRSKNKELIQSVQQVSAIAQETAAGVQEVNSASVQQDASIRDVAAQAEDIHRLSQELFGQISKFKIDAPEEDDSPRATDLNDLLEIAVVDAPEEIQEENKAEAIQSEPKELVGVG